MKYIMLRVKLGDIERDVPIIFPDALVHERVEKIMTQLPELSLAVPVSAGFVDVTDAEVFGKSETLKMSARRQDGRIIRTYDYTHGIITED